MITACSLVRKGVEEFHVIVGMIFRAELDDDVTWEIPVTLLIENVTEERFGLSARQCKEWNPIGSVSAEELVRQYFALEDPQRLEPAERELYIEASLDSGLTLRGYIDRLDRAPTTGELRVVDYKTGKAPRAGFEQRAMFQMRFYALMLWREHGAIPRLLQLIYLGSGELLRYEPDEADLRATERKLVALWTAIERAMTSGDWRPSPSRLCDWCSFQALCPAYGGTPPPLPETRDVNDTYTDTFSDTFSEAPSPRTFAADI
jgi:putative RecB family exonuclease